MMLVQRLFLFTIVTGTLKTATRRYWKGRRMLTYIAAQWQTFTNSLYSLIDSLFWVYTSDCVDETPDYVDHQAFF